MFVAFVFISFYAMFATENGVNKWKTRGKVEEEKVKTRRWQLEKEFFFFFFLLFFFLLCFPKHFICCKDNFAKILWVIGENEERVRF